MTTTRTRSKPPAKPAARKPAARKPAARKPAAKKPAVRKPAAKRAAKTSRPTGKASKRTPQEVSGDQRRRLRTALILLVITGTAVLALGALRSPFLDLDRITVVGTDNSTIDEVITASGLELGTPLVDVDLALVRTMVVQVPWVKDAKLSRSWNGSVSISVSERSPVMALPTATGFVLVDGDGRQLDPVPDHPDGFIPVQGVVASGVPGAAAPADAAVVLALVRELTPGVRSEVETIFVDRGQLSVTLLGGGRVILGSSDLVAEKVVSLETMLTKADLRCLALIDLRVPSAPALSRIGQTGNPQDVLADLTECS